MGVSAIFVGALMYVFPEMVFLVQILIFAVLSVISVVMYRSYRKKNPIVTDEPALNRRAEQYVGQSFTLKEPIVNGVGMIKVDDSSWKIKGFDIDAGETVRVVAVEGATLIVESSSSAVSYSPTMVPNGPLMRWNSSWMMRSGGRISPAGDTLTDGCCPRVRWPVPHSCPGHKRPWRPHSSLTFPNRFLT